MGTEFKPLPLPPGIVSRYIRVNDLLVHFLDASPQETTGIQKTPLLLLLHGFPELAFSWREMMNPLSQLGYRVIAPDLRGVGRTMPLNGGPYPIKYADPIVPFRFMNLARDMVSLVFALGYDNVACVIGHDAGSITAGSCALIRPDVFKSVVFMSAPFMAPDATLASKESDSFDEAFASATAFIKKENERIHPGLGLDSMLASMDPPRMYYQHYFSTPMANAHMHDDLNHEGLRTFLRNYFHVKSAYWPSARQTGVIPSYSFPRPLKGYTPAEMSLIPPYYMMVRGKSMPENLQPFTPIGEDLLLSQNWMTDSDLDVYVNEYGRTGFQGGLNRYRIATGLGRASDTNGNLSVSEEDFMSELMLFARKKVEVPAIFIAGEKDWGPYQYPGGLERMKSVCSKMQDGDVKFIPGAGHWVQQENPNELLRTLKAFLIRVRT